ncbi:MAG TPA: cobalamin-dependent protein [Ramlibacter sp.]|jgi:methylmalonyl-CoA mutase cobalamin-binding subunit|nr:cobalamin-dependent protein [Ramlibacter sp.]
MAHVIDDEGISIAAVEQATGIARATLRIWERRYGFPQPGRDLRGERTYPPDQLQKLRLIAALMARGHRPGRLVQLSATQLSALAGALGERRLGAEAGAALDEPVLEPLRRHDVAGLLRQLQEAVRSMGLAAFVTERMPQMNVNVGLAWARGELQVYEEHLYTEAMQLVLRSAIAQLPPAPSEGGPRVLLATVPEEGHGLGLLMAHALLSLHGCHCTSVGLRLPIPQIVSAATAVEADVVGLSFAASMNPAYVLRGLEQLRSELAPHIPVWAGGSSPVLARHRIAGVLPVPHIRDVLPALANWRALHRSPA